MKQATHIALKHVILKFCPTISLKIKRKTISDQDGQIKCWWFVIHAPEDVLTSFDAAWEQIQLQTGWKLELCFKPDSDSGSGISSSKCATSQSHAVVAPGSTNSSTSTTPHEQNVGDSDAQSRSDDHSLVSNSFLEN